MIPVSKIENKLENKPRAEKYEPNISNMTNMTQFKKIKAEKDANRNIMQSIEKKPSFHDDF